MPTNETVRTGLWMGGELVHTYNSQSRLSACSLFVPDGFTGVMSWAPSGNLSLQAAYRAPVPDAPGLTPTAGGVVETLSGVQGMRWTPPPFTALAPTNLAVGISRTVT